MSSTQLMRSESDRVIAGVAGGIAEHYELNATVVRLVWLASLLFIGLGLILYLVLWIVMPKGTPMPPAARIAEQRYASGEIDADELARIRSELERTS